MSIKPDPEFLEVDLPEDFVLEVRSDRGWIDYGRYSRRLFSRLEDGTYVCSGYGWSPLFLRVVEQNGNELVCTDESRTERRHYRLPS